MGEFHLKALNALTRGDFESYYKGNSSEILSKIKPCGVCDIVPDRLDGLDIPVFEDFHELIEVAQPHIVVIATPTATHYDIAKFGLEKGIHVFVEKPIVTKRREFETLLEIAKQNHVNIMAGHIERYNPVSLKLKEVLRPYKTASKQFQFTRTQPHDARISDDIVVDKLIHDLDLSMFLFGPVNYFEICNYQKESGKVFELRLRTSHDHAEGDIFVSWLCSATVNREVKLQVENKKMEGDLLNKTLVVDGHPVNCRVTKWIEAHNNQVKDELVDFVVYCYKRDQDIPPPLLSVDEIACNVRIIEEISETLNE